MNNILKNQEIKFSCGTGSFGNLYKEIDPLSVHNTLDGAWNLGYKYFDTAPYYGFGLSERRVGDFLRTKNPDDYILSTKVGRILRPDSSYHPAREGFINGLPFSPEYDYSYDGVMKSFEHSLQRLGLEKIDILYMHDIGRVTHGDDHERQMKIAMSGGYKALDELRSANLVKCIGLGVNEYEVCEEAMEYGDWDCFLLAGRYTLLEQKPIKTFIPKCKNRGSEIVVGGVFNSGILATGAVKGAKYNYEDASKSILEKVNKIESICKQYNITLRQAAIQFPTLQKNVSSILIGSAKLKHFISPLEDMKVEIPSEFWETLVKNKLMIEECLVE